MKTHIQIVIPCYNEYDRLDSTHFVSFAERHKDIKFIFVNDGSVDDTGTILKQLYRAMPHSFCVIELAQNGGKAEAVRQGMLTAFRTRADYVGYWDADLSTPLESILSFRDLLDERKEIAVVMGARVQLLGRRVERSALKHYAGRIFATAASLVLNLNVYDTQCGAKLFRRSDAISTIFNKPFISRWIFDVEIIARFSELYGADDISSAIYEIPLIEWIDKRGSKVNVMTYIRSAIDLVHIYNVYR